MQKENSVYKNLRQFDLNTDTFYQIVSPEINKILNFYDFINTIGLERMKAKQGGIQLNVKDHSFILQLVEIKTEIPIQGRFMFELQKGCQYVQKIKQSFEFNESKCYSFGSNWKMTAKAYKEKSMTFSLGLYRNNDGFLQFVDEFQLKLCEPYQAYMQQIKNHFFYYNRVCQEINNLQQVGQSWRCMKAHLKANKTFINILSVSGSMILRLSVEILNYFDTLAGDKIQKKQSMRTEKLGQLELQEKSTSSRNSLKNKIKKQEIKQKTHEKEIDLKVQSTLKPSSPTNDGSNTGTQQFFSKVEVDEKQNVNQFLPINLQALRSNTILSDIIELSNENQSHMNGDKTDRRGSDMSIPNPSSQKNNFSKTKTFHFGNNQTEKMQYHRNSTMQIFHSELSNQDQQQHIPSTLPSKVPDQQLTQQSTVFKSIQDNNHIMNLKSLFLIAILYAFISYLLVGSIQTQKIDIYSRFHRKDIINRKR